MINVGIFEYRGGCHDVHGGYHEHREDVQYHGRYHPL